MVMNYPEGLSRKVKNTLKDCVLISKNAVLAEGNREATAFFENELILSGWS